MLYKTISEEEYNKLLTFQKECPSLTFQNNGYEYIDNDKLNKKDILVIKEISLILKKAIPEFVKFNNFKISKTGEITLRFQYNWDKSFTGVGYLELQELKML